MKHMIRFIFNRERWDTVGSVASLVQVVAASIAEFGCLQNVALLLSGVSTALLLSADIRRRCAEHVSARQVHLAETTNPGNAASGSVEAQVVHADGDFSAAATVAEHFADDH